MKPIVVVSNVALDERNGAGMRAILPYLFRLRPKSLSSIFLTGQPGQTFYRGQIQLLESVDYYPISVTNKRGFRALSLLLRSSRLILKQFSSSFRNEATFLILPDTMRDVVLGLVCRLWCRHLVVWVMDDFVAAEHKGSNYLQRLLFGYLYRRANQRIVISEPMNKVYQREFGATAELILGKTITHVAPAITASPANINNRPLKIVYLGSFLDYSSQAIQSFIQAAHSAGAPKTEIALYGIHSVPKHWGDAALASYRGPIPSEPDIVRNVLTQFDFALLPYSFDEKTLKTMSLSFPSKLIDYLSASLPVILIAPKELSIVADVAGRRIGPVLTDLSETNILKLFKELSNLNPATYCQWSENSHKWAQNFFLPFDKFKKVVFGLENAAPSDVLTNRK